jgi:multicomponent Na+:H+ antiporter subunit C
MDVLLALLIGGLYAAGLYMMMRRSISKLVIGLILLSHGANLLIFTAGGLNRGRAPLIGGAVSALPYADPLPQAMILTAIVISFGVLAFTVVLLHRAHQTIRTDDLDEMKATDT